jgi:hypothetical protein
MFGDELESAAQRLAPARNYLIPVVGMNHLPPHPARLLDMPQPCQPSPTGIRVEQPALRVRLEDADRSLSAQHAQQFIG